jgi:uncharacterized protein
VIRVVVDSNVYVSALVFGGIPQKVLDLLQSRGMKLYVSQPIMDEVAGVLVKKFRWTQAELAQFLPPLWERRILLKPTVRLDVSPDPDDNCVLECAEAAGADFLITGNTKHFPKSYKTTSVVNPRQFLEWLASGTS